MLAKGLQRFKISIKMSITTFFLILLICVSLAIVCIEYFAIDNILIDTSKSLIKRTNILVEKRLESYLQPLSYNLLITKNLIDKGVIEPGASESFSNYLFAIIKSNSNIYGIHWSNPKGDFINIDREDAGKLAQQVIIRSSPIPSNKTFYFDVNGNISSTLHQTFPAFDPRVRPWYIAAEKQGKTIWSNIYPFKVFGNHPQILPGITAAVPVHDKQNQLKGVIGIDLTILDLNQFINQLDISPNSIIYITDSQNELVAYNGPYEPQNLVGKVLDKELIKELKIPFNDQPQKNNQSHTVSSYIKDGEEYFSAIQSFTISNGERWLVNIIIPANDILGQLKQVAYQSLGLAMVCILLGLLAVRYISVRISKPIIQLADEANQITGFNLAEQKPIKTVIYEINYMAEAFKAMRLSLKSFQRYIPSTLVKNLVISGQLAQVGGQNKELSFLFSDIKNFTSMAENISSEQLMYYLSDYFEVMTQHIIKTQGTLDKYTGDGMMAFWGAPLDDPQHAIHACQAALEMQKNLPLLNDKWQKYGFPNISIRIGINTGFATVGNMGSDERLSYTAIGDSVNVGSRLETLNKIYGTQIIVSGATYEQAKQHFTFRFLDKVAVRGKEQGISIYELYATEPEFDLKAYQTYFAKAFDYYEQGIWEQALSLFTLLNKHYPDDKLAKLFIKRCEQLSTTKPNHWLGIWQSE